MSKILISLVIFICNINKILVINNPIKIYLDNYRLKNDLNEYQDRFEIVYNASLYKAKNTLEQLVNVTSESNINNSFYVNSLKQKNIQEGQIDPEIINGVKQLNDYDLIIYSKFGGRELDNCDESAKIIQENSEGRPIIAILVVNAKDYNNIEDNTNYTYKIEFYSTLFLHQFTHILGFTRTFLSKYPSINFQNTSINRTEYISGKKIPKVEISSNNLLAFAHKYFNCNRITGIELEEMSDENISEECLNYIHWDARILLGEYMTSFSYVQEQIISEFTLIILEDTGLYKINKYTGGLMRFGKNVGCSFFTEDCNYNLVNKSSSTQKTTKYSEFENEFCASNTKTTCSSGRLSRGICDNYYSYSMDEKYAAYNRGWDLYGNEYADYCPISLSEKEEKKEKKNIVI